MRGLTLPQPWATLWALGAKEWETRGWITTWRGPLLIHAAADMDARAREFARTPLVRELLRRVGLRGPEDLPRGQIVGLGRLDRIEPTDQVRQLATTTDTELALGDFGDGRWAWRLAQKRALLQPIPYRGTLGLWHVDEITQAQVTTAPARQLLRNEPATSDEPTQRDASGQPFLDIPGLGRVRPGSVAGHIAQPEDPYA